MFSVQVFALNQGWVRLSARRVFSGPMPTALRMLSLISSGREINEVAMVGKFNGWSGDRGLGEENETEFCGTRVIYWPKDEAEKMHGKAGSASRQSGGLKLPYTMNATISFLQQLEFGQAWGRGAKNTQRG